MPTLPRPPHRHIWTALLGVSLAGCGGGGGSQDTAAAAGQQSIYPSYVRVDMSLSAPADAVIDPDTNTVAEDAASDSSGNLQAAAVNPAAAQTPDLPLVHGNEDRDAETMSAEDFEQQIGRAHV